MSWKGWIPVSRVFDIFSPPTSRYPCTNTLLGTGSPADISMAGQKTAWNLRMSFDIMWTSAGQIDLNRSSSTPNPVAVM